MAKGKQRYSLFLPTKQKNNHIFIDYPRMPLWVVYVANNKKAYGEKKWNDNSSTKFCQRSQRLFDAKCRLDDISRIINRFWQHNQINTHETKIKTNNLYKWFSSGCFVFPIYMIHDLFLLLFHLCTGCATIILTLTTKRHDYYELNTTYMYTRQVRVSQKSFDNEWKEM